MKLKPTRLFAVIIAFASLTSIAVAASTPAVSTGAATSVTKSSAVLHGTVNPGGTKTGYRFQYGLTTSYGSVSPLHYAFGTKTVPVSFKATRLLPGTVYHYQLVALNRVGGAVGRDRTFKTKGNPPPFAATGPTSQVSSNSATVTAVINPNNVKTTWYFQYGLGTGYGFQTAPQTLPAGASPVTVSHQLLALQSGTVFHYRIVAVNRGITEYGADAVFMTYPQRRPVPRVHARTRPRHDRFRPYVFNTFGRVVGPSSTPSQFACTGRVSVRFFVGRRRVSRVFAPVQPDCTFSAQTTFRHRPLHRRTQVHLKVITRFLGNAYLARNRAHAGQVTAG